MTTDTSSRGVRSRQRSKSEESDSNCLPGFSRPGEGKVSVEGIATGSEIWKDDGEKSLKGRTNLSHSQPSVSAGGAPTLEAKRELG